MGTTTKLQVPYPEGSDLLIEGDNAIRALAQRIETLFTPAWCASYTTDAETITGSGIVVVALIAVGTSHFTSDGRTITYTGPSRLFWLSSAVHIESAGATLAEAVMYVNGDYVSQSRFSLSSGQVATCTMSHLAFLSSGDEIEVTASTVGSGAGIKQWNRLSIMSAAPAGIST